MKKNYRKPEILFESFELSQNISAGCELISNQSKFSCALTDPEWDDIKIFMDGNGVCDTSAPYPGYDDQLCYHAPTDGYNVHSS